MSICYSIRFPMCKEKTGNRRGARYRRVPDKAGLWGARACAAGMVCSAIHYRDSYYMTKPEYVRMERLGMRHSALWARVFAGQIDQHDPRIDACNAEREQIHKQLLARSSAFLAQANKNDVPTLAAGTEHPSK